ncbi:MAG: 5'-nucleotidase, lipoprotein e(P4) family [Serratia inhibens]|uniref:5'-nucleotidase, lipoprotein e(P4) family n=1 Tax=Serratia inhibens TaxID=2338073 RepID=UPI003C7BD4C7
MKNHFRITGAAAVALLLASCATPQQNASQALSDQAVLAMNWMQKSAEYQAIALQTFRLAELAFDNATAKKGMKKAVVVDLDETMIDNSAYSASQIKRGHYYGDESWDRWERWEQAGGAKAIPGAVAFAHYVQSHDGQIFYISNRTQSGQASTADTLKKLGFPDVSDQTLLLMGEKSSKGERFEQVRRRGYDIVLWLGDNLNDFGDEIYHQGNAQRRDYVKQHQADFGTRFIVMPNPSYGDWEAGLSAGYQQASPQKKRETRLNSLESWDGTVPKSATSR